MPREKLCCSSATARKELLVGNLSNGNAGKEILVRIIRILKRV